MTKSMDNQTRILAALYTDFTLTGRTSGIPVDGLLWILRGIRRGEISVAEQQALVLNQSGIVKLSDPGWTRACALGLTPFSAKFQEMERCLWMFIAEKVKDEGTHLRIPVADVITELGRHGITEATLRVMAARKAGSVLSFKLEGDVLVPEPSGASHLVAHPEVLRQYTAWPDSHFSSEELKDLGERIMMWHSRQGAAPGAVAVNAAADGTAERTRVQLPSGQSTSGGSATAVAERQRTVFVVHGRNGAARDAMFRFLRSLSLCPLEWEQAVNRTGKATPYVGEVLDVAFRDAQAVVVLMTGDDEARLREQFREQTERSEGDRLVAQARPNVLFEAGMALGRRPDKTILVELGELRPFSDVGGRHVLRFSGSPEDRLHLAERLRTAECDVRTDGQDWLREGDFDVAIALAARRE